MIANSSIVPIILSLEGHGCKPENVARLLNYEYEDSKLLFKVVVSETESGKRVCYSKILENGVENLIHVGYIF